MGFPWKNVRWSVAVVNRDYSCTGAVYRSSNEPIARVNCDYFVPVQDHSRRGWLIAAANSDYYVPLCYRAVIDRDSFRFAVRQTCWLHFDDGGIGISEPKIGHVARISIDSLSVERRRGGEIWNYWNWKSLISKDGSFFKIITRTKFCKFSCNNQNITTNNVYMG